MEPTQLSPRLVERQNNLDWRLYQNMLVTRLFEEALHSLGTRRENVGASFSRAEARKPSRWARAWQWKKAIL